MNGIGLFNIHRSSCAVIGGAGFLGSHMVDHLIDDRRCRVVVLDNLISGQKKHIHHNAEFIWHDIRFDVDRLVDVLTSRNVSFVFNYAAEPYIPECFDRPAHFFEINASAVLNVMEACQKADVQGLLQVSSAEIYGDTKGKITEDAVIEPHSTYGVSKVAADGLVQVRWREANVPAIALRQFNCVGPRETHEYVIPEIIEQIYNHCGRIQLGNNSTRDFLYAGDAVKMACRLLGCGKFGQVFNMGSEEAISIYDLARLVGEVMGHQVDITTDPTRQRPWEIWHLQSDNTKLYSVIDTRPEVSLKHAIEKTVAYFHSNGNKWDW